MTTVAIMQPYFFPYIGYWQLIRSVERFIVYDDVNFIKGGWINRNKLLINSEPTYFTIPLDQASPNKRICDISLHPSLVWRNKLIKTIELTYRKSPFFSEVFPVIEEVIRFDESNLADYLRNQLQVLMKFMNISTELVISSRGYGNDDLKNQERVIDICVRENAVTYVNPIGGQSLYACEPFNSHGIDLRFISMKPLAYKQRRGDFVPYLSIVDALMEVGHVGIAHHLDSYDLVTPISL